MDFCTDNTDWVKGRVVLEQWVSHGVMREMSQTIVQNLAAYHGSTNTVSSNTLSKAPIFTFLEQPEESTAPIEWSRESQSVRRATILDL